MNSNILKRININELFNKETMYPAKKTNINIKKILYPFIIDFESIIDSTS